MGETEARKKWVKENTVFIGMRLQKSTDADILEHLEKAKSRGYGTQTEIKRLIRAGMDAERRREFWRAAARAEKNI